MQLNAYDDQGDIEQDKHLLVGRTIESVTVITGEVGDDKRPEAIQLHCTDGSMIEISAKLWNYNQSCGLQVKEIWFSLD